MVSKLCHPLQTIHAITTFTFPGYCRVVFSMQCHGSENEMCSIDPQLANVKHILVESNSSAINVDCTSMNSDILAALKLLLLPLRLIQPAVGFSVFYPFLAPGARARVTACVCEPGYGTMEPSMETRSRLWSVSPMSPYITPK